MRQTVGALPKSGLLKTAYAVFVLGAATAIAVPAQTYSILHTFDGTDGAFPQAGLVQATDGDLYGATHSGGANNAGAVFEITPAGTLTTLHSFCPKKGCKDGEWPIAALVQATNGDLYGTSQLGGAKGDGGIFKITPAGKFTTVYGFCSLGPNCADGDDPWAGLVEATNGDLYGTTYYGGTGCFPDGCGTIFKITANGKLATLYSFQGADGANPSAGLVEDTNGDFYGTTLYGGANAGGTVFKITPGGKLTTLYSYCSQSGCADGEFPEAGLLQATNGDFYGTTSAGGANGVGLCANLPCPYGTVFRITPGGSLKTLYSFCSQSNCADGENPYGALIQATDGTLYGTTLAGGVNGVAYGGYGTIFEITPGGGFTMLYSFCSQSGCADGYKPYAGLIQDTNGDFYGTAFSGGANSGTVFSLSVGLGPFVEPQTTSGKVGAPVNILGTNLTGATSVTFNGTPAVFTVVSSSEITTTVPTGATTGAVEVVTPGGTLSSNVPFRVP